MLPFPDDYYTVNDPAPPPAGGSTSRRAAMPANAGDVHIDAEPYNLNDGFSPGQSIVVKVPGLDTPEALASTDPVRPQPTSAATADDDAPVVVIDATTGERWPIWVELDSNAEHARRDRAADPPGGATSPPGTATSSPCATSRTRPATRSRAPEGFRYYRDDLPSKRVGRSTTSAIASRRSSTRCATPTSSAPTSTSLGLHGRQRREHRRAHAHMRDDAFAPARRHDLADNVVQGNAPAFTVDVGQNFQTTPAARCPGREHGPAGHRARSRSPAT